MKQTLAKQYLEVLENFERVNEKRPRFDDDEPVGKRWQGYERHKEKMRDIERRQQRMEHPRNIPVPEPEPEVDHTPEPTGVEIPFLQGDVRHPHTGFNAPTGHTIPVPPTHTPNFNDFKARQPSPISRDYTRPIGPHQPITLGSSTPTPSSYKHIQYTPPVQKSALRQRMDRVFMKTGRVQSGVDSLLTHMTSPNVSPTYDMSNVEKPHSPGWFAKWKEARKIRAAEKAAIKQHIADLTKETVDSLKVAPHRKGITPATKSIKNDIVALKAKYGHSPELRAYIDQLVREYEDRIQNYDHQMLQAFQSRKKAIDTNYKKVGKVMARKQGRSAAWQVLKDTPGIMIHQYRQVRDQLRQQAKAQRDAEHQHRVADLQNHKINVNVMRGDYVTDIHNKVNDLAKSGFGANESLQVQTFLEGRARNFSELMRNKQKVTRRHLARAGKSLSASRFHVGGGTPKAKRVSQTPFEKLMDPRKKLASDRFKVKQRRIKMRRRRTQWENLLTPTISKNTPDIHVEEEKALHTLGQVAAAPVTLGYKGARGVARFTGLNELPDAARDAHRSAKHHFIHGFLLR